jgi:hypothetical protein
MWRLSNAILRERSNPKAAASTVAFTSTKRFQHAIAVQLDYYMSPQFAGVASALVNNTYASMGLTDITFLPICPVGLEMERVRIHQNSNPTSLSLGTVEQNIFVPTLKGNPQLKTTAIAAMFAKSPLCIASLPTSNASENEFTPNIIGTHQDTLDIMRRIFPNHDVVASPRSTKTRDLINGEVGAIQAYTTTEVPALRMTLGSEPVVVEIEGYNGAKLGYSQVIFAADECLQDDRKEIANAFCEATFQGWANVIDNPNDAVALVKEAKKMLALDDEDNDHWIDSDDFELEMVKRCSEYVKGTFAGGKYGVIDQHRWREANAWLLNDDSNAELGFDDSVWK